MSWLGNLLRRARLRGLVEGQVQRVRAEALDDDAKDDAERFQDYGFAANPVDGQGLVINVAGHTIVLRMDRLADRPQLAAFEVAVWHKEGHSVVLKAGGLVQVNCTELRCTGKITAPVVEVATSLKIAGKEMKNHVHNGVTPGGGTSGPNQ